jgi:hypothetical protein
LHLGGNFTAAQLASVSDNGGTIYIDGTLTNTGSTLAVGPGAAFAKVVLDGTILGGTVTDAGSGMAFSGGTLNGVTYEGTLDLTPYDSTMTVVNGLTATGANGTGAGTINLGSQYSSVTFDDTQTFDNATITLGGYESQLYDYTTYAAYVAAGYQTPAETLTLGANLTLDQTGSYGVLGSNGYGGTNATIVNDGTINAEASGGQFYINPTAFTNNGTITVSTGDSLYIQSQSFNNSGVLRANGGNILVASAEADGGNATISGNSQIQYSAASNENITFSSGATGELLLLDSTAYTGYITGFTGEGNGNPATSDKIDLRDIDFSSTQFAKSYANNVFTVTDGSHTAQINMVGTYTLANFDFATDGSGGTLVTDPPMVAVNQNGQAAAVIADGATSELGANGVNIAFGGSNGTLKLDASTQFTGEITGFAGADTIDLSDISFGANMMIGYTPNANSTGGTLSVSDGMLSARVPLLGQYLATSFAAASDGHGGTMITDPVVAQQFIAPPHA